MDIYDALVSKAIGGGSGGGSGGSKSIEDLYDVVIYCNGFFGSHVDLNLYKGSYDAIMDKISHDVVHVLILRRFSEDGYYNSEAITNVNLFNNTSNGLLCFDFRDVGSERYLIILNDQDEISFFTD